MRCFIYCRKSSESEDRQVLSIDAQEAEVQRAFGSHADIDITGVYKEACSAKAPGRPVFNDMLARIERGEADAIIAWHPDRLARNSVDGGHIVYLLDRGKLQDLKFATFTFENNPQGKFMLAITFGYSKYYVDSLSQNVKRGNRAKIEQGWRPNMAPIGYRNDKETKTIIKDPEHYPYVRKVYEHMLTGVYTVSQIVKTANEEWGYRTPKRKRMGGGPLALSTAYHMLANPFYAGYILWDGQLHPGKHEPVVSMAEFERVQELLGRPCRPKAVRRTFAYTGLIRCGACGLQVTAEHKVNRHGSHYVYYHCTRVHRTPACRQPSIEADALDAQIRFYLKALSIPEAVHHWLLQQLATAKLDRVRDHEVHVQGLERTESAVRSQVSNLTDLRVRGLIDDDEFSEKRRTLQGDLYGIQERLRDAHIAPVAFEPEKMLAMFRCRAISWFDSGDCEAKRMILQILSSNPTLKDQKLSIQAKTPFRLGAEPNPIASLSTSLTKNRRPLVLPYGDLAAHVIETIPRVSDDYLFPASRDTARGKATTIFNGWGKAKEQFDQQLENVAPYTLHDLRRTFATNLAALGTPIHVTEKILNHISGTVSGVAAVYNRHAYLDEMRAAIDAWEAKLAQLLEEHPAEA